MGIVFLVATLSLGAGLPSPLSSDDLPQVLYVVAADVSVRAEPHAKSHAIAKLKPFDVVSGQEAVQGWLRIDAAAYAASTGNGWIPLARDNVVAASLEVLRTRALRVQHTNWPDRIKIEVLRGRIRKGFTADQVQLALGDPLRKELRHTANDVTEVWTYDVVRVVFSHTAVAAVEQLNAQ
jgi:hypothetical protein